MIAHVTLFPLKIRYRMLLLRDEKTTGKITGRSVSDRQYCLGLANP